MKNFKLLLATTAILSTAVAVNVEAGGSLTLSAKVGFLSDFEVVPVREISFGRILSPHGGETVIISADGAVSGTAKVVSTSSVSAPGEDGNIPSIPTQTGQFKVAGKGGVVAGIDFSGDVELTTQEGYICGTVKFGPDINYEKTDNEHYVYYNYGGTFTVAQNISIHDAVAMSDMAEYVNDNPDYLVCTGSGTATLVLNTDEMGG